MAISFVSYKLSGGATSNPPTHQAGDMILCAARRDSNNTAPSLPAGWNSARTASSSSGSASVLLCWRIATSSSEPNYTFTNASNLTYIVYRSQRGFVAATSDYALSTGSFISAPPTFPALGELGLEANKKAVSWFRVPDSGRTLAGGHSLAHSGDADFQSNRVYDSGNNSSLSSATVSGGNQNNQTAGRWILEENPPPPWPGYTDDFGAGVLNPFWEDVSDGDGALSLVGGVLTMNGSTGVGTAASQTYDVDGADLTIEVLNYGPLFAFGVADAAFYWFDGELHRTDDVLGMVGTGITSAPRFLRVQIDSGNVTYSVSSSGQTWTAVGSSTLASPFHEVMIGGQGGAVVDNFCILPKGAGNWFMFF